MQIQEADDTTAFCSLPGPYPLEAGTVARQRPDGSWLLTSASTPVARCSLWWSHTPTHEAHRVGLIGHYAAIDASAAAGILHHACARLAARGCTLVIGPMDGSTWNRYRLLTERGNEPSFFLEPDNPDDWPAHFTAAGFTPLAHYCSALNDDLSRPEPRLGELTARAVNQGICIRLLDTARFEEELTALHALCLESFRGNLLYSPLPVEEFLGQYGAIRPHVQAGLVLIAEQQGRPVGFAFGMPDLMQAKRGQPIDTAIGKTLAVHPSLAGAGLGTLLVARIQEAARQLGYRRMIHALMHEDNRSRRISAHTGRIIRRYALYARPLETAP